MFFYIALFVTSVIIVMLAENNRASRLFFCILWFVFAFRDEVSVDDSGYISAFEKINLGWSFDVEWSFIVLSKLAYRIGFNYKIVFFIYATLSIFFLTLAVDLLFDTNRKKGFYLACFYGTVFVTAMSIMRQFLAACICFYSIAIYLKKRSLKKSLLLIVFALVVHGGAIIAIPFLFLCETRGKLTYSKKIIIAVICALCGYVNVAGSILQLVINLLPDSYKLYSNKISGSYSSAGGGVSLALLGMFLLQCLLSYRVGNKYPIDFNTSVLEFGQLLYLGVLFIFVRAGVANRLSITFIPFIASLPYTFSLRFKKNQRKFIWSFFIVAMLSMYIITIQRTTALYEGTFIPYKWSFAFRK